ncbi:polysaccharide pyruvyl transferase family protein [Acinetobacter thermotolerans]|uniref:polysaccharide pyruvyl transferase family protein n=1 Tax=Acinetobacter thermotolerans TaxID=3151487 RepID=UPI00325B158F
MKRILIRSAQDPQKSYDALESTKKMGGNSGNLLYVNGVSRTLDSKANQLSFGGFKSHTLPDVSDWVNQVNKKYDHYVMPMANSFREGMTESLRGMTEIVRRLDIPVTVVGIGAQATVKSFSSNDFQMASTGGKKKLDNHKTEEHNRVVLEFCAAVLEKSNSIGVRGAFTKQYLVALGINPDKVRVIGCPSLYTWGPNHRIINSRGHSFDGRLEKFNSILPLSMNIDYRLAGIERMIYANLFQYPNITSPSQDSKSARMIITKDEHYELQKVNLGTPVHTKHPMFLRKNVIYYPNPWGWIHDLSKKQFVFGTRLHGNIAGILGGTPAHLLAHDARTMELANFHGIPYTKYDRDNDFLAEDLFKKTNYEKFNDLMPTNFANFIDFLHENNLSTIYDEKGKTKNFDKVIDKLKLIPPIYPM